jgi:hypothetical protein
MNYRRRFTLCGVAFSAIVILFVSTAWAQAPAGTRTPLVVGIWKLNPEKSNAQLPPDYIEIRQYNLRPDGYLVGLLIQGNNARGYHYLQFTAKSDGKDYPEYSDPIVADMIAAGKPTIRTYSEKIVDDYVTEWIDKVNGKISAQGKKTISKDGKTMTITVDGAPASQARVYDRQ